MCFKNCTDHPIDIFDESGKFIKRLSPCGQVIRVDVEHPKIGIVEGVPLMGTVVKSIEGLPKKRKGIFYIVSHVVREFLSDREDLVSPGKIIRNRGKIIGCMGLVKNG